MDQGEQSQRPEDASTQDGSGEMVEEQQQQPQPPAADEEEQPQSEEQQIVPANATVDMQSEPVQAENPDPAIPSVQENFSATVQARAADRASGQEDVAAADLPEAERNLLNMVFHLKWITFNDIKCPILTQSKNGPCALIALFNYLSLSGKVPLNEKEYILGRDMINFLAEQLLDSHPHQGDDQTFLQSREEALKTLNKYATGMNLNAIFTGPTNYEPTAYTAIYELLNIRLLHGLVYDPSDRELTELIGGRSYNDISLRIADLLQNQGSASAAEEHELEVLYKFSKTPESITDYGLGQVVQAVSQGQLAVLLRNGHYCVVYRQKDILYALVTDVGYLKEPKAVWEIIFPNNGDIVDEYFKQDTSESTSEHNPSQLLPQSQSSSTEKQEESDRQLAESLQWDLNRTSDIYDAAVAKHFMEEEDRKYAEQLQQNYDQQNQSEAETGQFNSVSSRQPLNQTSIPATDHNASESVDPLSRCRVAESNDVEVRSASDANEGDSTASGTISSATRANDAGGQKKCILL